MIPEMRANLKINLLYKAVKGYVLSFAKTQKASFTAQLEQGIRYFDLRVIVYRGQYRFVHGMYGMPVLPALREINAYLEQHRTEVVIINLQHFYEMSYDMGVKLVAELVKIFGDRLATRQKHVIQPFFHTPAQLTAAGKQVLILWRANNTLFNTYDDTTKRVLFQHRYTNRYKNTADVGELLRFLDSTAYLGDPYKKYGYLHITQLILTGNTKLYIDMGSLFNLFEKHKKALRNYIVNTDRKFNVVIMDFVDHKFSQSVLRRNTY